MSKSGSERRVHRRVDARFKIQGSPEPGGVVARMVANNLSMAGLHCTSSADFPELTRLAVRLMLPVNGAPRAHEQAVDVEAVVVRREETAPSNAGDTRFQLALFFTKVDDTAKRCLASFIDGHGASPAGSTKRSE